MSNEMYESKPRTLEHDESTVIKDVYRINEVETDEVAISVEPESALKKLYSKLINKRVSIHDVLNHNVCPHHSGVLKEVVVSSTDETVYLSLECEDDEHTKLETIVCIGCGVSVVEKI